MGGWVGGCVVTWVVDGWWVIVCEYLCNVYVTCMYEYVLVYM